MKGSLTGLYEYSDRITRCLSSGRLCLICKACKKWHLPPNFSLISVWLRKSPFSFRMSFTHCIHFVCQETYWYDTYSIVIYLLFHRVWFCITIWVGLSIVCNSDQKLGISWVKFMGFFLAHSMVALKISLNITDLVEIPLLISIFPSSCLTDVLQIQFLELLFCSRNLLVLPLLS